MKVRAVPQQLMYAPFTNLRSNDVHTPLETIPDPLPTFKSLRNSIVLQLYRAFQNLSFSKSTLHLAIGILDKLISMQLLLNQKNIDLVTGTLVLLCTKFNEVYPAQIKHINRLLKKQHSKQDYAQMEGLLLQKLDFNLYLENTIYEELSILEANYQGDLAEKCTELVKCSLLNPQKTLKNGSQSLVQAIHSLVNVYAGWRISSYSLSPQTAEIRQQLFKLSLCNWN